jgi:hypothetical protein
MLALIPAREPGTVYLIPNDDRLADGADTIERPGGGFLLPIECTEELWFLIDEMESLGRSVHAFVFPDGSRFERTIGSATRSNGLFDEDDQVLGAKPRLEAAGPETR